MWEPYVRDSRLPTLVVRCPVRPPPIGKAGCTTFDLLLPRIARRQICSSIYGRLGMASPDVRHDQYWLQPQAAAVRFTYQCVRGALICASGSRALPDTVSRGPDGASIDSDELLQDVDVGETYNRRTTRSGSDDTGDRAGIYTSSRTQSIKLQTRQKKSKYKICMT